MRDWNIELKFKIEDFWMGVFWQRDGNCLDLYVCILPCLPIHFSCWGERWGMPSLDPDDNQQLHRVRKGEAMDNANWKLYDQLTTPSASLKSIVERAMRDELPVNWKRMPPGRTSTQDCIGTIWCRVGPGGSEQFDIVAANGDFVRIPEQVVEDMCVNQQLHPTNG